MTNCPKEKNRIPPVLLSCGPGKRFVLTKKSEGSETLRIARNGFVFFGAYGYTAKMNIEHNIVLYTVTLFPFLCDDFRH